MNFDDVLRSNVQIISALTPTTDFIGNVKGISSDDLKNGSWFLVRATNRHGISQTAPCFFPNSSNKVYLPNPPFTGSGPSSEDFELRNQNDFNILGFTHLKDPKYCNGYYLVQEKNNRIPNKIYMVEKMIISNLLLTIIH